MAIYNKEQLSKMAIPVDLKALIENYSCCEDLLNEMESRFFESGTDISLITHSYLNDEERKNKDIMNNVLAINEVFKHISFVMETVNGDIIGYWHGLENQGIMTSPIVLYDTEGQFSILNGSNLTEALVGNYLFDDDEAFLEFQKRFKDCGINIVSRWDDLFEPKLKLTPENLHAEKYELLNGA